MSTGRFIGGLLIGGALGAIVGLLIAPRSGEETRELIRDELTERANRSLENVKTRSLELKDKARSTAEQLQEKGQQLAANLEDTGREAWEKIRQTRKSTEEITS
jgi:gas vesicle protein